jgi:hypothetical protein
MRQEEAKGMTHPRVQRMHIVAKALVSVFPEG